MKTIVITEHPDFWKKIIPNFSDENFQTPNTYLTSNTEKKENASRILNLSSNYQYQTIGYYVSLLGQARGDKVTPSILTIQDFNTKASKHLIETRLQNEIQKALKPLTSKRFELSVYFGKNIAKHYDHLCQQFYSIIPMPLFRIYFKRSTKGKWYITKILSLGPNDIPDQHHKYLTTSAQTYLEKKRITPYKRKQSACSVAMLINPKESHPPSNNMALSKFIKAGEKLGIDVITIQKDDIKSLPEYDGLFIRETTTVKNHTYQFSRRAVAEGLIAIDDPISILRCSNKVYLADLLKSHHIKTPETTIILKETWKSQIQNVRFPIIIKQPDSAFSIGVEKIEDKKSCAKCFNQFFKYSELIIAQEYMPSEYDWRIGILNNEPIFACQYFMAKNHWQIYNWDAQKEKEGAFETVPLSMVPSRILQTAIKACKPIGTGLYGVDLKYINNTPYVIEINDNPNIDHTIEDAILGDELYIKVMSTFLDRIRRKFHANI